MRKIMPQEIEVWYLLPSLRKEIARVFIKDYNMKQKEVADILGVTEAAVSQYLSSKRAVELKFPKEELEQIKIAADKIVKNKSEAMEHLSSLSKKFMGNSKTICDLHRKYDTSVSHKCAICATH
ncbi:MAG: transcriptional regulator [Nanoarchaeota archaeon]|nr:transcriptional regulator [Nanoarchaeota archaeon]